LSVAVEILLWGFPGKSFRASLPFIEGQRIPENGPAFNSTYNDVMQRTRGVYAGFSGHGIS
jgi:hypothetical protein